ncbi:MULTISPECIES: RelA/SpoT family protein [Nitrosomonas]|uniref:SpoT bifunctional enzyme (P)ppgpp synthetase II and guanosine-3',5'-bisdiphosphate 3'-pyro n=1 Tax=Nitrosomonas europaea (strain ATCC 19718 / CIP 103999 / KCTC 2705 / NBRC 14298) TaxID=228410 RepID=Q820R3_NITEU|nr:MULTISPECIES: bifunctional (p)ppGpp synthetase/guanosine-3',5'-bis(diphosphate) 3'-pyrophosphohydrolase [Nitrosomonas]CAD84279.1 spoT; bifunctional enzyme (p)ppgpp synthetase II and guanosine-3',5'-bisdiphosphate 3'-pyro [Nitrosomonas europaea ATCC 19718]SDW35108.1 GTP pyrophosphokinase [Nitrosomonas europaea]SES93723.1 GTP pyrophosphokinase [Nitrosomonas europaea]SJZ45130.1 GTP pyrophosphokinase [Nitrosomonas europaea]HBF26102.1 bifunctional (p)ppGpp synthetase/guanosine-3',5'-bis(diphosph
MQNPILNDSDDSAVISPEAELLISEVSQYLKPEDLALLKSAYFFSQKAHSGQFRKSGEPYISHPITVARILGELRLDAVTLTAALLHDVVEDTGILKQEISERFGSSVAELVDGVSKLDKIRFQTQADMQAENFRKMLLAMAQDVRVILIKLADRLHNMRTLEVMSPEKQHRIAQETLEIYAPIAHRLGLENIYQELQELGFCFSYPTRYKVLLKATKAARGNRREVVGKILDAIKQRLQEAELDAVVTGREKHLYSIYKKMAEKHLSFSDVLDIYGFRVIVRDVSSCYVALGALHSLYKPIPGKFKDYIAIPKPNGYQSLHSTLLGPYGLPIEIQIRTHEMHHIAEAGVASHWLYKSKNTDAGIDDLHMKANQWMKGLLETLNDSSDSLEFLEHLKVDLFPGEVYVFTPQGKILTLPRGATVVDFAYAVHTDVGNCCVAARINGEITPLRTRLKSGDRVEIITAPAAKPNPIWLSYVATGRARSSIRYFLRTIQYNESVKLGERLLNQALHSFGVNPDAIEPSQWEKLVKESKAKSKEALLADIALGKQLAAVLAKRLAVPGESVSNIQSNNSITILGTEGMAVKFARCCHPIPGDGIVGLIKKDQGLVIHMQDCPAVIRIKDHKNMENQLDVVWGTDIDRTFPVSIFMTVVNKSGVLARVTAEIAKADSNIDDITLENDKDYTTMRFILQTRDRQHLAQIFRRLKHIDEIVKMGRIKNL